MLYWVEYVTEEKDDKRIFQDNDRYLCEAESFEDCVKKAIEYKPLAEIEEISKSHCGVIK